jgi:hypothetical protein
LYRYSIPLYDLQIACTCTGLDYSLFCCIAPRMDTGCHTCTRYWTTGNFLIPGLEYWYTVLLAVLSTGSTLSTGTVLQYRVHCTLYYYSSTVHCSGCNTIDSTTVLQQSGHSTKNKWTFLGCWRNQCLRRKKR